MKIKSENQLRRHARRRLIEKASPIYSNDRDLALAGISSHTTGRDSALHGEQA